MITLPKEWKTYANAIRDRCRDLIEYKIWSGMDLMQFDTWRQNFITDDEKYFSSCLLDSLIYRSNPQTFSLINQILTKNLNNLFRTLMEPNLQNFPHCLFDITKDPMIRLVPVITSRSPVTKSSNEVLRFMKRHFRVQENLIINPWKIEEEITKGVKTFIFIDDFLGTGVQMEEAIIDSNLSDIIEKHIVVYAPLAAHEEGILYLQTNYPKLRITAAEKLESKSHCFFTNYFVSEQDEAKAFYIEMLKQRGINLVTGHQYGYGNLELTYAFEHAAPDNSLHALHKRNEKWSPLFNH